MITLTPISKTADTVTLSRADWERLVEALEDAEDIAHLAAFHAHEAQVGKETARADYLPAELVGRMIEGEHPLRIWREHRKLTAQALADLAGVARSYIAEIETGKKPGSVDAYQRLARALGVDISDVVPSLSDDDSETGADGR